MFLPIYVSHHACSGVTIMFYSDGQGWVVIGLPVKRYNITLTENDPLSNRPAETNVVCKMFACLIVLIIAMWWRHHMNKAWSYAFVIALCHVGWGRCALDIYVGLSNSASTHVCILVSMRSTFCLSCRKFIMVTAVQRYRFYHSAC